MINYKKSPLILAIILLISSACSHNHIMDIPAPDEITHIEISSMDSTYTIDSTESIDNIVKSLESVRSTKKQSTNDYPNVDTYTTIKIHIEDYIKTYYIYEKDSAFYVEEPYVGIWEIDEEVYEELCNNNF